MELRGQTGWVAGWVSEATVSSVSAAEQMALGSGTELRPALRGRRRFTTGYKLRILEQAEACAAGELGALLRKEGLYSSHLAKWRQQRATGALTNSGARAKGSAEAARHTTAVERENRRLRQRLERAETIIAVQKNSVRCCKSVPRRTATADAGHGGVDLLD